MPARSDRPPEAVSASVGRVDDLPAFAGPLVFADLHLHSRFSRATSPQMEVDSLYYWARRKGVGLLGTGDFTHPEHFRDLQAKLVPHPSGFYALRGKPEDVLFVPTAEISNIYSQAKRTRRVHTLLIARSLEAVTELNRALAARGNVAADGRPIFGFSARHLCALARAADPETLVVPAHIWTPWFSVLGERSGFDTLAECYEEELEHVAALETGLSSDPEMNWRLSQLDRFALISNSDAHSPAKLGRECNAFAGPLTWDSLRRGLLAPERPGFRFTVEFFPEEGKYHWPGHSTCKYPVSPEQFLDLAGTCPVCGKPLTHGVASRVEALADRPRGYRPANAVPEVHLVPLVEIIAESLDRGTGTKAVFALWDRLVDPDRSELELLLFTPIEVIGELAGERVAEGVRRMRRGDVLAQPGYDGVYGRVRVFETAAPPAGPYLKQPQLSLL